MEGGCLTFTTASTPPTRPSIFFNSNSIKQFHSNSISQNKQRRTNLSVKASSDKFSTRNTVSSNWDVSSFSKSPSFSPRIEELDTTNMLLRQRIVFLGSPIDEAVADFVIGQLLFLDAEDSKKDIKLFINSPGGSSTAAMGIYDAIKMCKADVSTICMGLSASMASLILASGTRGKRFCMPNGRVMIHQVSGTIGGNVIDTFLRAREVRYGMNKTLKILSRITGKTINQIKRDILVDKFMNPWEAKDYGMIDAVIDDGKPGLVAPIADASPPDGIGMWYLWSPMSRSTNPPSEEKLLEDGYEPPAEIEEPYQLRPFH